MGLRHFFVLAFVRERAGAKLFPSHYPGLFCLRRKDRGMRECAASSRPAGLQVASLFSVRRQPSSRHTTRLRQPSVNQR